jgi:hypothetical protein
MARARWLVGIVVIAVALGVVGAWGRRKKPPHPPPRLPAREVTLEGPESYWSREGYVLMDAPVRPPTSEDGRERIVVYLKLPAGGVVTSHAVEAESRVSLEYPAGTVADRVEYVGSGPIDTLPQADWRVMDVRGTSFRAAGEEFHVYRAPKDARSSALLGVAWPRGDAEAQEEATSALVGLVEDDRIFSPRFVEGHARFTTELRFLNDCGGCHVHDRAPRLREDAPPAPNRGADSSGLFQVPTVLSDRAPLETYRPRNANADDPFVRFVCGASEEPAIVDKGGLGHVTCAGGEVPEGVLDLGTAIRLSDAHALRVCASRRSLFEHLDEEGKTAYRSAMAECDLPGAP